MKISFILPLPNDKPVGGFRVVYEYAERLAGRGHAITIYYPIYVPILHYRHPYWLRYLKALIIGKRITRWFKFNNVVSFKIIPRISNKYINDSDIVIATAVPTAYEVDKLGSEKGNKYYLIQHYEIWDGIDIANNSYKLGLKNIVIAKWLEKKLFELGAKVEGYIPNSIDLTKFVLTHSIEDRNRFSIASIYHVDPYKGSKDAIMAFKLVKDKYPQLKALLFSVYRKPQGIPSWIEYVYNPSQTDIVKIYNKTAIFVSSSISEGFGLPGMEALACGCALASTDSLGVREYAIHNHTALLSEPEDPEKLAENIIQLIENDSKRRELANNGYDYVKIFSWDRGVNEFEKVLVQK